MIFLKNLFLLLILSVALFAEESIITSQEIISTDSPEELIGNEVHTYESLTPQNLYNVEEQMQSTIETINSTPIEENISSTVEKPTISSNKEITPPTSQSKDGLQKTFSEALTQAKKEHKIILLEIYENGCKYCEKMEGEVFPKEKVINELKDNFVLLKINGDEQELPLGLSLQMTPMHVFVSENKEIKDMTFGFLETDDFLKLLEKEKN